MMVKDVAIVAVLLKDIIYKLCPLSAWKDIHMCLEQNEGE